MKEKKLKKTEEKSKEMISTIDENVMQIKNLTNENEDLRQINSEQSKLISELYESSNARGVQKSIKLAKGQNEIAELQLEVKNKLEKLKSLYVAETLKFKSQSLSDASDESDEVD